IGLSSTHILCHVHLSHHICLGGRASFLLSHTSLPSLPGLYGKLSEILPDTSQTSLRQHFLWVFRAKHTSPWLIATLPGLHPDQCSQVSLRSAAEKPGYQTTFTNYKTEQSVIQSLALIKPLGCACEGVHCLAALRCFCKRESERWG
uniref:Uncharacterized protein n=1 Tax=Cyclopterus lumpus TaxID=8103 RepID=A0A8C2Z8D8_CYCLU